MQDQNCNAYKRARRFSGIFVFALLILTTGCRNSQKDLDNFLNNNNVPSADRAEEITLLYSDNGVLKAKIYGQELIRAEGGELPHTDINKGVKVTFLDDSGNVENTLTAMRARIFENTNNVIVREQVRVVSKKGEILETEELVWNQRLNKMYTNKKVKMTTPPAQVMYGDGLEATADFSWYKVGNLKGNIDMQGEQIPE